MPIGYVCVKYEDAAWKFKFSKKANVVAEPKDVRKLPIPDLCIQLKYQLEWRFLTKCLTLTVNVIIMMSNNIKSCGMR